MNNNYKIINRICKRDGKIEYLTVEKDKKKYFIKKVNDDDLLKRMLKNEIECLKMLNDTDISPKLIEENLDIEDYIVLEFIEGTSLNKMKFSSIHDIIDIILKIIDKLIIVHNLGIIHNDIKPDNIIITSMQEIKILDFGISSRDGINHFKRCGHIDYISPSSYYDENLNYDTDIYSLGIMMYELIYGQNPFGKDLREIIENKKKGNFIEVENPLLNLIFSKVFKRDHERKYETLEEFKRDIKLLL